MANYIGIDVSKDSLDLYYNDQYVKLTNNQKDYNKIKAIVMTLQSHHNAAPIIALEPTGGYERALTNYLKKEGIQHVIINTIKMRSYAKAIGMFNKTDKLDAEAIYQYAKAFSLEPKDDYNNENQQRLLSLVTRRQQLLVLKNQETNKLETLQASEIIRYIKQHIKFIENQIQSIETSIDQLVASTQELSEKAAKLQSIPGVGKVLATHIIAELPEIGKIDSRKLVALVGIAPYEFKSGSSIRKRSHIAYGRANIRRILFMSALASLRANKVLKKFFDRLVENKKPKKVALVAVMKKLIHFMNAIIAKNSVWQENYA